MLTRVGMPYKGVSDATPFIDQPGDTTPPGNMRNVRIVGVGDGRFRLRQRPGLRELFPGPIGSGAVQALQSVTRASVTSGYEIGTRTDIEDFRSVDAGALVGQAWALEQPGPQMLANYSDPVTSLASNTVAWHPDGQRFAYTVNYNDGSDDLIRLVLANIDGTVDWAVSFGVGLAANDVLVTNSHVYVATTTGRIAVYTVASGTFVELNTLNRWANETTGLALTQDGRLAAVFHGASRDGTLPNLSGGTAITGGTDFRSGIIVFDIEDDGSLSQVQFGQQLSNTDALWEANHGYFRFSEQSRAAPLGCYPTGIALDPTDGGLIVTRTNAGWGPNGAFPPDPTFAGAISVCKVSASGALLWETDADSQRPAYDGWWTSDPAIGTLYTDRADPTFRAVAASDDGVFVAGLPNLVSNTCEKLRSDGVRVASWGMALNASVAEGAIAIDPTDGSVWAAGARGTSYPGAGSAKHLFKLDPFAGDVLASYDLDASVDAFGVDVSKDGRVAYATGYVS